MEILVSKTKALEHQVTFDEMRNDPAVPDPNFYAYYYGSFTDAAKEAFQLVCGGKVLQKRPHRDSAVLEVKPLEPLARPDARQEQILDIITDLFVKNNGRMPSYRLIFEESDIKLDEIQALKNAGLFSLPTIRHRAAQKTGKAFVAKKRSRQGSAKITKKEVNNMSKNAKKHYTREECIEFLSKKSEELGHIPTQLEVNSDESMPCWNTLNRKVGPWQEWDKILVGYPFSDRVTRKMAKSENPDKAEPVVAKQVSQTATSAGTTRMPIELIVPDGFHGHVSVTVDF